MYVYLRFQTSAKLIVAQSQHYYYNSLTALKFCLPCLPPLLHQPTSCPSFPISC